jgi:protein required for transport of RNA pol II
MHADLVRISVPLLYKTLTTLLRPTAPEWFRAVISENLALLPLRPHGVRWAIEFIAMSHSRGTDTKANLSHDTLLQISKLLSSVPKSLTPEAYFVGLSRQLLQLLDDVSNPELSQVAGFVITNGILSKRSTGAPGSIGWRLFAEPQLEAFGDGTESGMLGDSPAGTILVSQSKLATSLRRLSTLVLSNPSPSLTGRLIRPVMMPLWALWVYDRSVVASSDWNKIALNLLQLFLQRCGTTEHLQEITSNLLWDGPTSWVYGPGSEGGIEIRHREETKELPDIAHVLSIISSRSKQFIQLVSNGVANDEKIGQLLLSLLKSSLLGEETKVHDGKRSLLASETDHIQKLVKLQLGRELLDTFGQKLARNPKQILDFVNTLIRHASKIALQSRTKPHSKITIGDVRSIVQDAEELKLENEEQVEELISTSISLLNITVASKSSDVQNYSEMDQVLHRLETLKDCGQSVSSSTMSSLNDAISMLRSSLQPDSKIDEINIESFQQIDRNMLDDLVKDLSSPLAPERTAALKSLQRFILTKSVTLDVPTVSLLLLDQIRTDSDEFVFLAAISALDSLATLRDPVFVTRATAELFQDTKEATNVDGRLRIGEALARVIQIIFDPHDDASAISSPRLNLTLRLVAETVIVVASRRGNRKRESKEQEKSRRVAQVKKGQAEQAWGGEVPEVPNQNDISDDDEDISAHTKEWRDRDSRLTQQVLDAWQNTGFEEDVRIRTSALNILGELLEHASAVFTAQLLGYAVELALSILKLEYGPDKAILRRAAVMIFMSHLRAGAVVDIQRPIVQLDGMQWLNIEKTLQQVINSDEDDLTKGHAEAVLESLEAWRMIQIRQRVDAVDDSRLELKGLKGLEIDPSRKVTKNIQEIE